MGTQDDSWDNPSAAASIANAKLHHTLVETVLGVPEFIGNYLGGVVNAFGVAKDERYPRSHIGRTLLRFYNAYRIVEAVKLDYGADVYGKIVDASRLYEDVFGEKSTDEGISAQAFPIAIGFNVSERGDTDSTFKGELLGHAPGGLFYKYARRIWHGVGSDPLDSDWEKMAPMERNIALLGISFTVNLYQVVLKALSDGEPGAMKHFLSSGGRWTGTTKSAMLGTVSYVQRHELQHVIDVLIGNEELVLNEITARLAAGDTIDDAQTYQLEWLAGRLAAYDASLLNDPSIPENDKVNVRAVNSEFQEALKYVQRFDFGTLRQLEGLGVPRPVMAFMVSTAPSPVLEERLRAAAGFLQENLGYFASNGKPA